MTTSLDSELVALEGHKRLTAYLLEPSTIGDGVAAIIGVCPEVPKWDAALGQHGG
jgi:hypothetical protein